MVCFAVWLCFNRKIKLGMHNKMSIGLFHFYAGKAVTPVPVTQID